MRFFSFFLVLLLSVASNAALRPLSEAEREGLAAHIVEGEVLDISSESDESIRGKIIDRYKVQLKVTNIASKESSNEIKADDEIEFSYKKITHKAQNWGGNTGQSRNIKKGQIIKAYLSAGPNYSLLEPNGFVVVQETK
jgi:hypothetical protein